MFVLVFVCACVCVCVCVFVCVSVFFFVCVCCLMPSTMILLHVGQRPTDSLPTIPNCQERCPFGLLARLLLWFGEYFPEVQGGGDGGDRMPHRTDKNRKVQKVSIGWDIIS